MLNQSSWKNKIDPSFDKIVKAYLSMLSDTDMIRDSGWFALRDEYLKKWEEKGSKGWYKEYESFLSQLSKNIKAIRIPKKFDEKERIHLLRKRRIDLFADLESLPVESQQYYKQKFKPFYSEVPADQIPVNVTKEDLAALLTDFYADYALLEIHKISIEVLKNEKEPSDREVMKLLNFTLFSAYNTISLVVFGRNIYELIKEGKNGNQDSFFKALQIDRTIIESTWAIKMIRKAQLSGDEKFFKRMAKAIAKQPLTHDKEFTRAIMIIILFWHLGLNKLTNSERIELLEECGIRVQDDPESFRRFANSLVRASQRNMSVISSLK